MRDVVLYFEDLEPQGSPVQYSTVVSESRRTDKQEQNKRFINSLCHFRGNTNVLLSSIVSFVCSLCTATIIQINRLLIVAGHHYVTPICWTVKGKCVTLRLLVPKTNRYCCCFSANKQLFCLLPDRFDAKKATRLCCHTDTHTRSDINQLFMCFLPPTRPYLCLSVTVKLREADKPDKPGKNNLWWPFWQTAGN